jgi:tetratricopeptide (TPR) repeat protein
MNREMSERQRIPDIVPPKLKEHPEEEAKRKTGAIELNAKALELMAQEDYGSALHCARGAVAKDADNPTLLTNMAIILCDLGKHAEAAAPIEKAIRLQPGNFDSLLTGGAVFTELDEPRKAVVYLRRAAAVKPGDLAVRSWLNLAEEKLAERIFVESAGYYVQTTSGSLKLNVPDCETPKVFEAAEELFKAGDRAQAKGDSEKARTYWMRAGHLFIAFGPSPRQLDLVGDRMASIGEEHEAGKIWTWAASGYMGWRPGEWGDAKLAEAYDTGPEPGAAMDAIAEKLQRVGEAAEAQKLREGILKWRGHT